jgi:catechol 2,3-dioxygenase-like lactoylglutathione lyase family enzyme
MAQLIEVHHTGLTVSDIETSIGFYRDVLGLELITRQETDGGYLAAIVGYPEAKTKNAHLRVPGTRHILELFEYLSPSGEPLDVQSKNAGAAHVCFIVDDLRALHRELQERRVDSWVTPPVFVDAGPSRGGWALYLTDPDGIRVELFQLGPRSVADVGGGRQDTLVSQSA